MLYSNQTPRKNCAFISTHVIKVQVGSLDLYPYQARTWQSNTLSGWGQGRPRREPRLPSSPAGIYCPIHYHSVKMYGQLDLPSHLPSPYGEPGLLPPSGSNERAPLLESYQRKQVKTESSDMIKFHNIIWKCSCFIKISFVISRTRKILKWMKKNK